MTVSPSPNVTSSERFYRTVSVWVCDLIEYGIHPHPGPSIISQNIDGANNLITLDAILYKASQRHPSSPDPLQRQLVQNRNFTGSTNQSPKISLATIPSLPYGLSDSHQPPTACTTPQDEPTGLRGDSNVGLCQPWAIPAVERPTSREACARCKRRRIAKQVVTSRIPTQTKQAAALGPMK